MLSGSLQTTTTMWPHFSIVNTTMILFWMFNEHYFNTQNLSEQNCKDRVNKRKGYFAVGLICCRKFSSLVLLQYTFKSYPMFSPTDHGLINL